jgi:Family of unknown function (DUF6159)
MLANAATGSELFHLSEVAMFDRMGNGFALAGSSWRVLKRDKQLVVFPILSGIACIVLMLGFWLPVLFDVNLRQQIANVTPPPWMYAMVFAYYFCSYFVIVFFNSALISCALMRFNGETPTVGDGLSAAASRLPQIFAWAFVSATVGVLLYAIESAHEKVGEFISAILGTAWTVMTYFVVPVLVVEKLGPFAAISRSVSILKQTWGEALVGKMGLGFFIFLLMLPGILLLVLGAFAFASGQTTLGLALIVGGILYLIVESAVAAALQGIFVGALYQYAAHGVVPEGFDGDTMRGAFGAKDNA